MDPPSISPLYRARAGTVENRAKVLTRLVGSGYPTGPQGPWTGRAAVAQEPVRFTLESRPIRMAVTRAWARLAAPSFW